MKKTLLISVLFSSQFALAAGPVDSAAADKAYNLANGLCEEPASAMKACEDGTLQAYLHKITDISQITGFCETTFSNFDAQKGCIDGANTYLSFYNGYAR